MGWRQLDSNISDPFYVTALDEAISIARKDDKVDNTLHFYRRNTSTISVGRSRKIDDDIDIDICKKNNVKIVRRTTGGGSIYTDKGCLIYSLIFDKNSLRFSSPLDIFESICNCLVSAFKKIDIITWYKQPNDILLNEKKISGSAQILKEDIILIHGTVLVDTNIDLMNKVLKQSKQGYVSTIYRETKKNISFTMLKNFLKKEFEVTFDTGFEKTDITEYEENLVEKLLDERYHNDSWNYMR